MIRKANKEDAEKIANNNLLLAFESENISIGYKTVYNGVKNVIEDNTKGFYLVFESLARGQEMRLINNRYRSQRS